MTAIRKILAGICAFLFVLSGFAALLLYNVERKAFSAETYKQAFKQQGLYEDAAGLFAEMIVASTENPADESALMPVLSRDELELVISALLPPQELEALTDDLFDSIFNFLNGESDSVTISLVSLKRNMAGEGGVRAITQLMQVQPSCTTEQLIQMGLGMLSSDAGMTLCKPPDEMMGLVMPLIEIQFQFITSGLPDELTLFTTGQTEASRDFRPQLDRIRTVMKLSLLLPVVFLLAITFLVVRSLSDWLKWWGIPLLITGIFGTLTALAAAPLVSSMMGVMFSQNSPDMPPIFLELIRNMTGSLTREILRPVTIQGILLTVIGFVMIVVNAVIHRNNLPARRTMSESPTP